MYKPLLLLVVCVFYCLISVTLSEDNYCEIPLQECNLEINTELIPGNKTEVPEICTKLFRYRSCVLKNKFKNEDLCGWPLILKKSESLIDELCYRNTSFRLNFLRYIPCVKTVIRNYKADCEAWLETIRDEFTKTPNIYSDHCLNLTTMIACYKLYTRSECGGIAEYILREIVKRSFYIMVQCYNMREIAHQIDLQ
ncbi:unnamed protein product [Larinioides sclopetarius]|uniref:DUF19 domain-containing protein n=1 Tax=Larinioides sclopetarius TaxID=280406 RepID=A0AAV2B057_9ARAC